MSDFDNETTLLLTRVGSQLIAFSLDDVVRISPCNPANEIASEAELRETAAQSPIIIDDGIGVEVLNLAEHLQEATCDANCVLECMKGQLLVADAGTVQPLGNQLVCEVPELVRNAAIAAGVQRVIWDDERERWRLWLLSERVLDHAANAHLTETDEEAA